MLIEIHPPVCSGDPRLKELSFPRLSTSAAWFGDRSRMGALAILVDPGRSRMMPYGLGVRGELHGPASR